jgi:hypothetical protein
MATSDATPGDSPFPDYVDAKHITGDYYFVQKYSKWYWYLAAALCLGVPPAGVFLVVFFISSGIHTPGDEIDAELAA